MRRPSLRFALPLCALGLILGAAPILAAPQDAPRIYRWVDADGIAHYTSDPERIPTALRGQLPAVAPQPEDRATTTRSTDVWAERDRPPEADEVERLGDDFGFDDPAREARIEEIDGRIEQLLGHIATDEEALKLRVVGPDADAMASGGDEELRSIAARLPGLLAELQALRAERATLEAR